MFQQARQQVKQVVNQQMVATYWEIGRLVAEHEQQGEEWAEYGKQQIEQLSKRLTSEFGKGFAFVELQQRIRTEDRQKYRGQMDMYRMYGMSR